MDSHDTSPTPAHPVATIPPGRWLAACSGVFAGAFGIAVAGLAAGTNSRLRSPILSVGDVVVDVVPLWLKDLAIALFGTNDKVALLAGIGIVLTAGAAAGGLAGMRRHVKYGIGAIVMLGLVGGAIAVYAERWWPAALPSLLGAAAGSCLFWWLHRAWFGATGSGSSDDGEFSASRRRLLSSLATSAVAVVVAGGTGRLLDQRFDVSPARGTTSLPAVRNPLPPHPVGAGLDVPGLAPFVTANEDFYRIDTALAVPRVSPDDYLLRIFGMVDHEIEMTYADLFAREQVEADITLTCVSNEVGGKLVGNARWQGVLLEDLLAEVGIHPDADQVVGRSYDDYTCGFPLEAARDGRQALVAIGMNGEPLPLVHGYPARLVVPGLYGYVSATKWLREIELTTFTAFDHYWERRGWAEQAPIKTQSRIDTPTGLSRKPVGPGVIAGVAWAQTRGIDRVEVCIDDLPWQDAELATAVNDTTWRQWHLPWDITPGRHTITCRATDTTGTTQDEARSGTVPDGATGWHTVVVTGVEP